MCCERDFPKDSKPTGVTQLQIQAGRHVAELDKVIDNLKRKSLLIKLLNCRNNVKI
jgi:hypothetical protein